MWKPMTNDDVTLWIECPRCRNGANVYVEVKTEDAAFWVWLECVECHAKWDTDLDPMNPTVNHRAPK